MDHRSFQYKFVWDWEFWEVKEVYVSDFWGYSNGSFANIDVYKATWSAIFGQLKWL